MNFKDKLDQSIEKNDSLVCVGLDPDLDKMPEKFKASEKPLLEFNKYIIDETKDSVCAYKPNSAFYEALGAEGIAQLKDTFIHIQTTCPEIPVILDFKRGDIGNTNDKYAHFAFEYLAADAITLHPYQGGASLKPYLDHKDKGIFVLAKTSNDGSGEFQDIEIDDMPLYEHVVEAFMTSWDQNDNVAFVAGATYPQQLEKIREIAGQQTLILVPGIGAQGGNLEAMLKTGLNKDGKGLIINSSRGIIYSENPGEGATQLKTQINQFR